jgi:hypothetical protein
LRPTEVWRRPAMCTARPSAAWTNTDISSSATVVRELADTYVSRAATALPEPIENGSSCARSG